jgi:carboxylate-amine ligase
MTNIESRVFRAAPTVGVEEEFLLVDPATGQPLSCADQVADAARELGAELQAEITRAQIETNTPPCHGMQEVRDHLLTMRSAAAAAALRCGARLVAAGVPLVGPLAQPISDTPRYQRIAADYGLLAAEHAVCGCHVHVEVPDRDTAVQVCNHLRPWLPTLLALTANSAVHQGHDTGYASWRSVLASRWPCAGAPPYFTSAEHYDATVAAMLDSGAVLDEKMIYWDARPSSHLPTVEVRVSDVPATIDESTLLAVLVRALVMTATQAVRAGEEATMVDPQALRMAYWRAAHDGMTGHGLDLARNRTTPALIMLDRLVRHVEPALTETGELRRTNTLIRKVLDQGNGAMRQRRALSTSRTTADLIDALAHDTLRDWWPDHAA